MEGIESIIFDWGGVLIDDPGSGLMQYCADAFGVSKEDYIKVHWKFAADFQKGSITEDTFWACICNELNVPKPNTTSLWTRAFQTVYSPKNDMFALVCRLQKNSYKTALLSNAEIPTMNYFYQQRYDMFDVLVFSCAEGTKKPERKVYELALEKLRSKPSRSVFIDDRVNCINGAKEVGLNTILFKSAEQVKTELSRLSVKID
ncbi:MAG: HAD family hydrolase [Planctomycetota bacterium]|jgi:epoxide hydrolase-like predicted phosphatase